MATPCMKRASWKFSKSDRDILLDSFDKNPYPTFDDREGLAILLGAPSASIMNWFHNQRNKVRRDKKLGQKHQHRLRPGIESTLPATSYSEMIPTVTLPCEQSLPSPGHFYISPPSNSPRSVIAGALEERLDSIHQLFGFPDPTLLRLLSEECSVTQEELTKWFSGRQTAQSHDSSTLAEAQNFVEPEHDPKNAHDSTLSEAMQFVQHTSPHSSLSNTDSCSDIDSPTTTPVMSQGFRQPFDNSQADGDIFNRSIAFRPWELCA